MFRNEFLNTNSYEQTKHDFCNLIVVKTEHKIKLKVPFLVYSFQRYRPKVRERQKGTKVLNRIYVYRENSSIIFLIFEDVQHSEIYSERNLQ